MVLANLQSKVASIVQRNLNNLVSSNVNNVNNLVNSKINNLVNNSVGSVLGNVNNFAKKLISRSPLEIKEDDDTGGITNNPFNYGVVHYPEEVAQLGMGHYMIFDIIENNKQSSFLPKQGGVQKLATDRENINELKALLPGANGRVDSNTISSGITTTNPTHTRIASSIILYTPPNLKTTFTTDYEEASTGLLGSFYGGGFNGGEIIESLKAFGREIVKAGLSVIGQGDFGALRTKISGEAINPQIETVFRSVPMRTFNYVYDFAPKNKKELDMIHKIITLFKFHMLPDVPEQKAFLITPSEFNITYMYLGKKNNYIPRIARCVLKNMEIDQSPEGVISTFMPDEQGAFPTYTKLTLTFLETEIMTKQKIAKGF